MATRIDGKTVLITGSTDGVGRYVAAKLAAAGAKVLIHGRDRARAESLAEEIRRQGHAEPTFYQADLSSLAGTRRLAEAVLADQKRLDLFISNAGIGSRTVGPERRTSADGHELRFAELSLRLPAGASPAALAQGKRAVAHRQCCLARSAPDRFRRRDDHQRL
jgi:NAD(P)-dependent dehydrogenase (short-subunit alcohol dehydrogenase family)